MDESKYAAVLTMLIPQVIGLIVKRKNISEKEAVKLLYSSELYRMIDIEETKLWHFSAETLITLLDEELSTGKITYPEEV